MMPCSYVNKKGFINAFSLFLIQFIAMLSLLYTTRYRTLLAQQQFTQQGNMCELYILHHINKKAEIKQEIYQEDISNDDEEERISEETDETKQENAEDMPMELESEILQFKDCDIMLEYQKKDVVARYRISGEMATLHITLDDTTKEIMDIAYE